MTPIDVAPLDVQLHQKRLLSKKRIELASFAAFSCVGVLFGISSVDLIGRQRWSDAAICIALLLTISQAPRLAGRLHIATTPLLQIAFCLFLVAGPYLGSVQGLYWRWPFWDALVHFASGGLIAALTVATTRRHTPANFAALTVYLLAFGTATAGAWEIIEFCSDTILGTNAQADDLIDTMADMIAGTIAPASTAALCAGIHLWRRRTY